MIRGLLFNFTSNMKNNNNQERKLTGKPFVFQEIIPEETSHRCRAIDRFIKPELIPKGRSGHRMVTDNLGNIYVLGGYNPEGTSRNDKAALLKDMWRFNMVLREWSKVETSGDVPSLLCSFAAVSVGDCLFIHGGTGVPFARQVSSSLYMCKLRTGLWTKIRLNANFDNRPSKLYGQSIVFDPDEVCLYSVGGTTGFSYPMNIYKFDLRNFESITLDKNTSSCNAPPGRYRHEIVLFDKKIYVFGGGTDATCFDLKWIPVFNLAENNWEMIKALPDVHKGIPVGRKCHGCVTLDTRVFMVGGLSDLYICDDLWKFDLLTNQWTFITNIPSPIFFHSVSISNTGQMTIFGGANSLDSAARTNTLYSVWLDVPSLEELAWIAFINHCPNIGRLSRSQLTDLGLTSHLIDRLNR